MPIKMAVIGRFLNAIKKRFSGIIKKRFKQKMMMVRNAKNWQSPRARYPVEKGIPSGVPFIQWGISPFLVAVICHHKILILRL